MKKGKRLPGQIPKKKFKSKKEKPTTIDQNYSSTEEIRLNKFIAHAGLCSRREADTYIGDGKVQVNGKVIKEMGFKVRRKDDVVVDGQKISLEPFVYLLLNKPKNTITTTDDDREEIQYWMKWKMLQDIECIQ